MEFPISSNSLRQGQIKHQQVANQHNYYANMVSRWYHFEFN